VSNTKAKELVVGPEAKTYILTRMSIDTNTGCWEWQRYKSIKGYGQARYDRRGVLAHRLSYAAFNGSVSEGMSICHTCDNPSCVNPIHLFEGTCADNTRDCVIKGRHVSHNSKKTHCPAGHPYTVDNTYVSKQGGRHCKACDRARSRAFRLKKKQVSLSSGDETLTA